MVSIVVNRENIQYQMNLFYLATLQEYGQGTEITLQNGKVIVLLKSDKEYDHFSQVIIKALKGGYPVGLAISEDNKILAAERADNDFVRDIIPRGRETFEVWFQGHDGIFKLYRSHPRLDKIYTILDRSRIEHKRIWFVSQRPGLEIVDAI